MKKSLFTILVGIFLFKITPSLSIYPAVAQSDNSITINEENVFFADVVVRGKPVFQVGALDDLTAKERANIINRRIASIIASYSTQPVNVDFKVVYVMVLCG